MAENGRNLGEKRARNSGELSGVGDSPCIVLEGEQPAGARSAKLRAFISDSYAPWLMQTPVRIAVLVVFFLWFFVALWMCTGEHSWKTFVFRVVRFWPPMTDHGCAQTWRRSGTG